MQVANGLQFTDPGIETVDAGAPCNRVFVAPAQRGVELQCRGEFAHIGGIGKPDGWAMFQPAFKVGTPENLLNELLAGAQRLVPEYG